MERVQSAEESSQKIIERANSVDGEIERLLGELCSATAGVVESLKSGAGQLRSELAEIRTEYESVREARLEGEPSGEEPAVSRVAEEENGGPPDVEPEVVAEVEETAPETPEVSADEDYGEEEIEEPAVLEEPVAEPEEEEELEPEGEPEPARTGGRSIRGAEGARLIALNMALNGTPREETARYLEQNFDLDDQDALLDEVYARVGD